MEPWVGAERGHDGDVEAAGAERGVGGVDDVVAGRVEGGGGGSQGDGFAGADVSGDDTEGGFLNTETDPGDGFGVAVTGEELVRGDGFRERGPGETEMFDSRGETHRGASVGSVVVM